MKNQTSLLYVCSPLSAPTEEGICENMKRAKFYAEEIAKIAGCRTIAPHAFLPKFLDDNNPAEREIAINFGLDVITVCSGIVICGSRITEGMAAEIASALGRGLPVYHYDEYTKTLSEYFLNNHRDLAMAI